MKSALLTLLGVLTLYPISSSYADDEPSPFSGNIALTSDYVYRGISQSNEEPTIQGGLDWADGDTGLYAGIWASGVDFEDATTEMDVYGGISGEMNGLNWDVGLLYYFYPGSDDSLNYNYWEIAASVGYNYDFMQTSLSLNYSPENFGKSGQAWYPAVNIAVPLPKEFTADASLGYQWIEDNAAFGVADYATWSLGVGYKIYGFNTSLKYTDTNLNEPSECADGCGSKAVFTVSRSF